MNTQQNIVDILLRFKFDHSIETLKELDDYRVSSILDIFGLSLGQVIGKLGSTNFLRHDEVVYIDMYKPSYILNQLNILTNEFEKNWNLMEVRSVMMT